MIVYKTIVTKWKMLFAGIFCCLLVQTANAVAVLNIPLHQGRLVQSYSAIQSAFIADPEIADYHIKAPKQVYIYAKKIGSTTFYTTDKNGKIIQNYKIQVAQDLSSLDDALHTLFPSTKVHIVPVGEHAIAIKGSVQSSSEAEDIRATVAKFLPDPKNVINLLHVQGPGQINLRVEIIELVRTLDRAFGLDWLLTYKATDSNAQIHTSLIPTKLISNPLETIDVSGMFKRGNFSLTTLIRFLEQNNLATILSEPNLTAQSGESASFLVGGEFPVLLPSGVAQAPGVVYKNFGVSLTFSPTVLENNRINVQIKSEVSEISTQTSQGAVEIQGFSIPALTVRRAKTTVELASGQSFAIAGLLQNNSNKLFAQLPGIGNTPVLGALFRSQQFQRNETELVIIVTPYLVTPSGNQQLINPARGLQDESPANHAGAVRRATGADQNIGFILQG